MSGINNPLHPGDVLKNILEKISLTIPELSKAISVGTDVLLGITQDKSPVTAEIAIKLALAFNTKEEYWIDLQKRWELFKAREIINTSAILKFNIVPSLFPYGNSHLRETEEHFKIMADAATHIIFALNPDGSQKYINKFACQYLGVSLDEIVAIDWPLFIHPEDLESTQMAVGEAITNQKTYRKEHRLRRYDGEYRWFLAEGVPTYHKNGALYGYIGSGIDIHDFKVSESALKESAENFQALADNVPNLVWMADAEGSIYWYNKRWYEYTGTSFEEMEGWGWRKVHDPYYLELVETRWKESLANGFSFEMIFPLKGANNRFRQFLTRVVPIKNEIGVIIRWFGSNTDIDDQKALEEKLQETAKELSAANEEILAGNEELRAGNDDLISVNEKLQRVNLDLDNFIYTASHDLKAPIANIEALMNRLVGALNFEERLKVEKFTQLIEASVLRFKKTVENLTDVAKLQKEEEISESLDLLTIFQEVKLDLIHVIEETNAELEILDCNCYIKFSHKNLKSVIYNLISNALKYRSPERLPVIRIKCYDINAYKVISIEDNGLGISSSNVDSIFLMFKRLHNHVEGSGLGLYLVKRIIDNAGGKIEVDSKIGEGSTFKIFLRNG